MTELRLWPVVLAFVIGVAVGVQFLTGPATNWSPKSVGPGSATGHAPDSPVFPIEPLEPRETAATLVVTQSTTPTSTTILRGSIGPPLDPAHAQRWNAPALARYAAPGSIGLPLDPDEVRDVRTGSIRQGNLGAWIGSPGDAIASPDTPRRTGNIGPVLDPDRPH